MGIFTGSTPNQHRTASDGQTGLLLQQKLIIKTEKLSFIAPHQHSFMIKLPGLAVNYSVPKTKQGPCRIGEGHCPLGIYSYCFNLAILCMLLHTSRGNVFRHYI